MTHMPIADFKALTKKKKYANSPTLYGGRKYSSKLEVTIAKELDLLQRSGKIVSWIPQVPFPLPGVTATGRQNRHYVDFLVFLPGDRYKLIEAKGFKHKLGELKRSQVVELYKVNIEVRK